MERIDTKDIREKILSIYYLEWEKMVFGRGNQHYMKKNAKGNKPFTLNQHVGNKIGIDWIGGIQLDEDIEQNKEKIKYDTNPKTLLVQYFFESQERTIPIMLVSLIDNYLTKILLKKMNPIKNHNKHYLFRPGGPLSSVYTKNFLSYELNCIDEELFETNKLLIELRNKLAHKLKYDLEESNKCIDKILEKLSDNKVFQIIKNSNIQGERPLFKYVSINTYLIYIFESFVKDDKKTKLYLNPEEMTNIEESQIKRYENNINEMNSYIFSELFKPLSKSENGNNE